MSETYKVEALIVLASKASDDLSELINLVEKLGKIYIQKSLTDVRKYNILAKLLNSLRQKSRATSIRVKQIITIDVTEPER